MKKRTAYQCDYCNKLRLNITQAKKHELICFWNPASKSCITCKFLGVRPVGVDGLAITDNEMAILEGKVEGTFHVYTGYMEVDSIELNDEYKYLYDAEPQNFCKHYKKALQKLTHNCEQYKIR
jgi:hypothetical protein